MLNSTLLAKIEKTSQLRRGVIDDKMQSMMDEGRDCSSCSGICCTFVKNSMMVTPIEAVDVYIDLKNRSLINDELIKKLRETVKHFRLDIPVAGDGKRSFSRRRYTCPFFDEVNPSCGVSRLKKPYGCLSFNPLGCGIIDGEHCASDQGLLAEQENRNYALENDLNLKIKKELSLNWDKQNLPMALLCLLGKNP